MLSHIRNIGVPFFASDKCDQRKAQYHQAKSVGTDEINLSFEN